MLCFMFYIMLCCTVLTVLYFGIVLYCTTLYFFAALCCIVLCRKLHLLPVSNDDWCKPSGKNIVHTFSGPTGCNLVQWTLYNNYRDQNYSTKGQIWGKYQEYWLVLVSLLLYNIMDTV